VSQFDSALSSSELKENYKVKIADILLKCETVEYLRSTVTNQSLIEEEMKGKLIRVVLATFQFRPLSSSVLLSENLRIRTLKIIIVPVVLCECEIISLTLSKGCSNTGCRGEYLDPGVII
jgi:hypothetical protein